ncbi:hypothetical protein [Leptobacterium sp. I13]|uniref:hypothetical protein n=1 Tax=Leptobacterium meishanense TaxID=3128904 RepID=UPI0030EB4914
MYRIFAFTFISIFILNCTTKKHATTTTNQKFINNGYFPATLFAYSNASCPYVFQIDGQNTILYDPINLNETQKTYDKIWVKYASLKRPNRCANALPVTILDIQKREQ